MSRPIGAVDLYPRLNRGRIEIMYDMSRFTPNRDEKCNNNAPRTTLTLSCRPGTLGYPVFKGMDDDCHFFFTWHTSAACSTKQSVGANCAVTDRVTSLSYDLSRWSTEVGIMQLPIPDNQEQLLLSVCGTVPDCGVDVGACVQSPDGQTFSVGKTSDALIFADGELRLVYIDGIECLSDPSQNFSTIISFVCPDALPANESSVFYFDCTYYYTVPTVNACSRRREVSCVTSDPETGYVYDLSVLEKPSKSNTNYIVTVHKDHDFQYILNVCHAVNKQASV